VTTILLIQYQPVFVWITFGTLIVYIAYTIGITEWRTNFRRSMNELDSKANTRAVDSLINYETVKYFGNEDFEAKRYDESMQRYERAAVKSQSSLSLLNIGQSTIIAIGVTLIMWQATVGVVEGRLTSGRPRARQRFMIQLYIPLNFLGVVYREIKQSIADMERLFALIHETPKSATRPERRRSMRARGTGCVRARAFRLRGPDRQILSTSDFTIAPGTTCADRRPERLGQIQRWRGLLYRFLRRERRTHHRSTDRTSARCASRALRAEIGIVPQDTCSSTTRSSTTSDTVARARRRTRSSPPRRPRTSTTSSRRRRRE
jgi:ATP-binding cassette subfamily B protein